MSERKRIDWIDIAKGIAIILVIIGHTVPNGVYSGELIRGIMFSFHMPMFFILSCMTYRCSESMEEYGRKLKRSAKHLLVPALIVWLISLVWQLIQTPQKLTMSEFWVNRLYTFLFASGVDAKFAGKTVYAMGIPWFFFALFLGRAIFDYLHLVLNDKQLPAACIAVSLLGILLGKDYLPFSLDVALASMLFFWIGHEFDRLKPEQHSLIKLGVSFAVWVLTLWLTFPNVESRTYLELAIRRYPMFPISYLCAAAGTLFMCELAICINKLWKLYIPVAYIGRNSLYLLLVHCIDGIWKPLWRIEDRMLVSSVLRVIVDLAIFVTVMLVKYVIDRMKSKKTAV